MRQNVCYSFISTSLIKQTNIQKQNQQHWHLARSSNKRSYQLLKPPPKRVICLHWYALQYHTIVCHICLRCALHNWPISLLDLNPELNGWHFADDLFKYIFLNIFSVISINISLEFISEHMIEYKSALVHASMNLSITGSGNSLPQNRYIALTWTNNGQNYWHTRTHAHTHTRIELTSGTLQWRYNEHGGISNHWCLDCLLNPLSWCRSKKTLTHLPLVTHICVSELG